MQEQVKRFPPATVPVQSDGWLSPRGVFYPCGFGTHAAAAREIAGTGALGLEESGWVHISDGHIWSKQGFTQAQLDALFDMQMVNPRSVLGGAIASLFYRLSAGS